MGGSSASVATGFGADAPGFANGGYRRPRVISFLPAVFAKERNEPHRRYVFPFELVPMPREEMQNLLFAISQWNEKSPILGELFHVRFRNVGRRSSNENCIERRELAPSQCTVAEHEGNVVRSHLL